MTKDTKIEDAGFNVRARMILARKFGVTYDAVGDKTLGDVAQLEENDLSGERNCGDSTMRHFKDVLLKAGLYLRGDTLHAWTPDRVKITEQFIEKAKTEPDIVVRLLCDHMTARELTMAAAAAWLNTEI